MKTIRAFFHGMMEFRLSCTANYEAVMPDGEIDDSLQGAYDWGREWAHRLTLRFFEGG